MFPYPNESLVVAHMGDDLPFPPFLSVIGHAIFFL
jgi:hypothetical protein